MIAISSGSLKGYGLHKIFMLAQQAGFDAITLDVQLNEFDTLDAGYLCELSRQFSLPIISVQAFERKMDFEWLQKLIAISQSVGASVLHLYPPHRLDKEITWFTQSLPSMAPELKKAGLTLSVMNVEPKTILFFIPEYKDATLAAIKKVTGSTTLSVSQVNPETGIDLMKTYTLLSSTLAHVIVSDTMGNKVDLLPGTGEMPLESFLAKCRSKFSGDYTLRIAPKELRLGNDQELLGQLRQAREFIVAHAY
jgi:hypothetical protein